MVSGAWQASRVWVAGDQLFVRYALRTRTIADRSGGARLAIFHGPWLLGIDAHDSRAFFDEPFGENRIVLEKAGDGAVLLDPAPRGPAPARDLIVPVARFRLRFLPGGCAGQDRSHA